LFVVKRGETYKPYYVGKTTAQTGFQGEIFQKHKLAHYSRALQKRKMGYIFLFPLVTNGGRFSRANNTSGPVVEWLERILIGFALRKNADLQNKRDTKLLREVWVEGVFGKQDAGRAYTPAVGARRALF
jgi:hypothetical protein